MDGGSITAVGLATFSISVASSADMGLSGASTNKISWKIDRKKTVRPMRWKNGVVVMM